MQRMGRFRRYLTAGFLAFGTLAAAMTVRGSFQKGSQVFFEDPMTLWEVGAKIEFDRRRYEGAIAQYERALHERPNDIEIAYRLADLYFVTRDYESSIRILRQYAHLATEDENFYYRLGLNYDLKREYQKALGFYGQALKVDPDRPEIHVRMAQVRLKQGFPVDAAKILDVALGIDPDYSPAVEEMKIVRQVIRSNCHNVYRQNNMVITYDDYLLLNDVEAFYPYMEAHRRMLEERFKYHIPTIWVRISCTVEKSEYPLPAYFDEIDGVVLLSCDALHKKNHVAFGHELAWLYLTHLTEGNAPRWLTEGLALLQAHPGYLDHLAVRDTNLNWVELDRRVTSEKRFLDFDHIDQLDPEVQRTLQLSYLQVRYLLERYGWQAMRRILNAFRTGETQFTKVIKDTLYVTFDRLVAEWNMFAITRYYFDAPIRHLDADGEKIAPDPRAAGLYGALLEKNFPGVKFPPRP